MGSGRDAHSAPGATIPGGAGEPASRPGAASRKHRAVARGIELNAIAHLLRSRGFRERVIVGGIVLLALRRLARENRSRAMARLAAWDKRQSVRNQRTARAPSA